MTDLPMYFNPRPLKHMTCPTTEHAAAGGDPLRACGRPLSEPCPCEQGQSE